VEGRDEEIGANKVKELLKAVDTYIQLPVRDLDKPFYMPIENIFSIQGRGTVISGKLERGVIKKGDDCEIMGYDKVWKTTITGIEMFKKQLERAEAGDQLGALIRSIKRDELRRGLVLGKPGSMSMHNHFEAQIYLLSKEEGGRTKPFTPFFQTQMFCGTWDQPALLEIPDKDLIMPGEDARFIMNLRKKMVLEKSMRFTVRDGSGTLGYGVVTNLLPERNLEDLEKDRIAARDKKRSQQEQQQ
jgi:elongation factor Tu